MGCDIHMVIQQKINGEWQDANVPAYDHRNYDLFGMLADVRNGYGFAGVDLGDGFVPIPTVLGEADPQRGLPEDFSCVGDDHNGKWMGDHSYSHLLLSEALGADGYYDRTTKHRGVVSEEEYKAFRASSGESPESYCGGISGRSIRNVSSAMMDKIIADPSLKEKDCQYYTQVEWVETYRESAGTHWFKLLDEWKELDPDPNNVRLVFGFDS